MKHTIYGTALLFIVVMVIAGVMIVSGKEVRENEIDKALNTAVEQTLEQLREEGGYEVEDPKELIGDFQQTLLMHISSDSELQVNILAADTEKGVLDVEVRTQYKTIKGTSKHAVCRKTVILEEYSKKATYHVAEFLVDGSVYDQYSIYEGSAITFPATPKKKGFIFRGWKNSANQEMLAKGMFIKEDTTFEAVFQ